MLNQTSDKINLGITSKEALLSLKEFGLNEIQREKVKSKWLILFEQFRSPLVVILIFACIASLIIGDKLEAVAISAIIAINALIGFLQEFKAETAIAALQETTAPRAKVLRDGRQIIVLTHNIVPNDILILEAGDIIAADSEVLAASHLQINEAILTGESMPVEKIAKGNTASINLSERSGLLYMGTSVSKGTGTAKVNATGMKTELGKIAHLISSAQIEHTPLQKQLARMSKIILFICLTIVTFIGLIGLIRGISWLEVLTFSLSLAVAAIPEGLPAVVTVALALGVRRMAKRHALVKELPSVETLGCVSVICTDKTGTLTTGNMRVRELWAEDKTNLLKSSASCCNAELSKDGNSGIGDPTEIAILIAANDKNILKAEIEKENARVSEEPFDSTRKRMSILRKDNVNYVKGAPEAILPLCGAEDQEYIQLAKQMASNMSTKGLRVLAVATGFGSGESKLTLVGLLGIADPPREEVMQVIKEARAAGIKIIMITGDNAQTASAIARELGILKAGDDPTSIVHARANPEEKLKLIRFWKSQGAVVAMTGDGVNDAPALKEAHIGIAMGKAGTEVTRQAADLILADDNFATIIAAIREGRGIFENIRKSITYLLTGNFAEVALVVGGIVLGLPLPLLAAHLLWINLVTDALPALTLIVDPLSTDSMTKNPRPASEQIMRKHEWLQVFWVGLLEASVLLAMYFTLLKDHEAALARNLIFTTFVFSQLLRSLSARSPTRTFWRVKPFSNLWLIGVAIFTCSIQLSLHYLPLTQAIFELTPLTLKDMAIIVPISLISTTAIEIKKILVEFF